MKRKLYMFRSSNFVLRLVTAATKSCIMRVAKRLIYNVVYISKMMSLRLSKMSFLRIVCARKKVNLILSQAGTFEICPSADNRKEI